MPLLHLSAQLGRLLHQPRDKARDRRRATRSHSGIAGGEAIGGRTYMRHSPPVGSTVNVQDMLPRRVILKRQPRKCRDERCSRLAPAILNQLRKRPKATPCPAASIRCSAGSTAAALVACGSAAGWFNIQRLNCGIPVATLSPLNFDATSFAVRWLSLRWSTRIKNLTRSPPRLAAVPQAPPCSSVQPLGRAAMPSQQRDAGKVKRGRLE